MRCAAQLLCSRRFAVALTSILLVAGAGAATAIRAAAAGASRCHSNQLAVRIGSEGAALGHIGVKVRFVNISASTCALYGYPGLQMLGAADHALPTEVHRGVAYTVPKIAERSVTLHPGASAAFDAGWDDATGYGLKKCPTSSRVLITPPDAYRSVKIAWRIQPYGGGTIQHLRCGQITVSPVFASAGATG
jgi:hypothetical protein